MIRYYHQRIDCGTTGLLWTISNAVVSDQKDTVQVIVYPPTIRGTLASGSYVCATANTGVLSLQGL